jgi:hypothetical protein
MEIHINKITIKKRYPSKKTSEEIVMKNIILHHVSQNYIANNSGKNPL